MKVTEFGYKVKGVIDFYADKEVLSLCFDAITRKLNSAIMMGHEIDKEYIASTAEALATLAKLIKKLEEEEEYDRLEKLQEEEDSQGNR